MTELIESVNIVSEPTPWTEISDPSVLVQMPLVSVDMITYNHAPYIARAIEGVLQQETNFPIELVIGEDCSTDCTREIVLGFQKKYPNIIRVIISRRNFGANINSHRVRKACRGKYIAFCEGDDFWHHPRKLQIQVDYLEEHPEYGLVYSGADLFDVVTGKKTPHYSHAKANKRKNSRTLIGIIIRDRDISISTCTVVVRRKIYEEICRECSYEFSEKFWMQDYQTFVEFAYRSKVKYIDKSLATYNLLPNSLSRSNDFEYLIKHSMISREIHLHYANKYGGNESGNMEKIIARRFLSLFIYFGYKTRNPKFIIDIIADSKKYGVTPDIIDYIYFVGSKNNISSSIIRFGFDFIFRCWRSFGHIKWLRAIRDHLRR